MLTSNQSELSLSGRKKSLSGRKDCQILLICQDEQWELTNGPTRFALASLVSHSVSAHFSAPPLFFFFLAMPYSMWDLSSLTRDGTHATLLGAQNLKPWTSEKSLEGLRRPQPLNVCLHAHMLSCFSHDQVWRTNLRNVAHQAPPSMGFSRQEYRTGLPFLPPGDLPYPGINQTLISCIGR